MAAVHLLDSPPRVHHLVQEAGALHLQMYGWTARSIVAQRGVRSLIVVSAADALVGSYSGGKKEAWSDILKWTNAQGLMM